MRHAFSVVLWVSNGVEYAQRWWHRVCGHTITYHPQTKPNRVIRDGAGRPLIQVFEQVEFAVPIPHYACSCGVMWEA